MGNQHDAFLGEEDTATWASLPDRRLWGGNALRLSYILCHSPFRSKHKRPFSLGLFPIKVAILAAFLIIVDKISEIVILEVM